MRPVDGGEMLWRDGETEREGAMDRGGGREGERRREVMDKVVTVTTRRGIFTSLLKSYPHIISLQKYHSLWVSC